MFKGRLNEKRALCNLEKAFKEVKAYAPNSKDDKLGFDGRFLTSTGVPCRYQVKSSLYHCKQFMLHAAWQRIKDFTALILVQGSDITFIHMPERLKVDLPRLKRIRCIRTNQA